MFGEPDEPDLCEPCDDEDESLFLAKDVRAAVVMYDRATEYGDMFPRGSRTHADTLAAFREWTKPGDDSVLLRRQRS